MLYNNHIINTASCVCDTSLFECLILIVVFVFVVSVNNTNAFCNLILKSLSCVYRCRLLHSCLLRLDSHGCHRCLLCLCCCCCRLWFCQATMLASASLSGVLTLFFLFNLFFAFSFSVRKCF
jgi:hypothetical protein